MRRTFFLPFFISPLHFPHTFPLSGQCIVSAPRKKAIGSQRCEVGGLCQRLITLPATFYVWQPALSSSAPPSLPHLLEPRAPGPLQYRGPRFLLCRGSWPATVIPMWTRSLEYSSTVHPACWRQMFAGRKQRTRRSLHALAAWFRIGLQWETCVLHRLSYR